MHASSALSPADAMGSPDLPVKVRLVACIGAAWPESVQALGAKWLKPNKLLKKLSEPKSWGCWLGYVSPIALLLEQQPSQASALEELLDAWLEHTTIFLKARELAPERCRLINLSHLDAACLSLLLDDDSDADGDGDSDGDADSEGADPAAEQDPPDTLPLLLQLYLQRRPDVLNRYADLEGQADLLGREPEFSLPLQRPDPSTWATLLLQAWQAQLQLPQAQEQVAELESQLAEAQANAAASTASSDQLQQAQTQLGEAREEAELTLLQLHQVQEELEHIFLEHRQSQEQVTALESQLAQANAAAEELRQSSQHSSQHIAHLEAQLAEAKAAASTASSDQLQHGQAQLQQAQTQLSEAREEAELTLLQLHQVQEELEYQFLEHRKASQERDALQEQLASLRAEMGYYFLLSQADPCLDQSRIPQLKGLMRDTLIRR